MVAAHSTCNMPTHRLLEICVESVDRAAAAERGGADRIELCGKLAAGGVTPSAKLMRAARNGTSVPIHALIRPRLGDFVYSNSEFEAMKRQIQLAGELGMDGIVLGLLDEKGKIDEKRTSTLIKLAHPLPATFHRAFDLCGNLSEALPAVIETGAERVLTSGGKARAVAGLACLAELVARAGSQIVVMPGGGVRASNVARIMKETGAREIHSSLETARNQATSKTTRDGSRVERIRREDAKFEARVCELRRLIEQVSARSSSI
jgi:copper homeostasis protein